MKIGSEILRLRKKNGMTQENFAEKIEVSRQAVAKWESGETLPEIEKLIAISTFFGTTLDSLIKGPSDCAITAHERTDSIPEITDFLCRAKIKTYAGKGAEITPSRPHSHDLKYEEDGKLYIDTYLGSEKFIGEEALWIKGKPFWAMNYAGRVLDQTFSGDFLKECLSFVTDDSPFRGPAIHSHGEFTYHCSTEGDFSWFKGTEEIYFKTKKVYQCLFHGGVVI